MDSFRIGISLDTLLRALDLAKDMEGPQNPLVVD